MNQARRLEIRIVEVVKTPAPFSPNFRPKRPAMMALNKGRSKIKKYIIN